MIDWTKATTGELVDRIRGGVNEFDSRLQHTVDDTLAALAELERRVTGRLVEKDMADAPRRNGQCRGKCLGLRL